MAVGTLYVEELRATMRGRFAWLGAGVMLFAVGCVATVGTQDTWLDGYGIIAYFLVPLAFIPLSAVFLANPRANRFAESVFTAVRGICAQARTAKGSRICCTIQRALGARVIAGHSLSQRSSAALRR